MLAWFDDNALAVEVSNTGGRAATVVQINYDVGHCRWWIRLMGSILFLDSYSFKTLQCKPALPHTIDPGGIFRATELAAGSISETFRSDHLNGLRVRVWAAGYAAPVKSQIVHASQVSNRRPGTAW